MTPPRQAETRITALMPADGWRLVTVQTTREGVYAGVRADPITAWVAVDDRVAGFSYVTHMPAWNPRYGGWSLKSPEWEWNEIGYLPPGEAWVPADWEADGRERVAIAASIADPARLGPAVDRALGLLEARRRWLAEYPGAHRMRDAELAALTTAIVALESALDAQRRGSPPRRDDPR
jgi:hypothetical protein